MDTNVSECNVSTNVKSDDSGNNESMMYLLPTAANKPPTGSPNRGSNSEGCGVKLMIDIRKAMYIPMKIFMNNPQASRSMSISILNAENTWLSVDSSPKPVS